MLPDHTPERTPTQRARLRLRILAGLLAAFVLAAVLVQYTPYALLPQPKTVTLWGVLVGILVMALIIDRRWATAARRDRVG